MQAKDIPDLVFLATVYECELGICDYPMDSGWHGGRPGYAYNPECPAEGHWANWMDIARTFSAPGKVVLAKARKLINRGLMTGCTCGCRGDFELTDKGLEIVAQALQEQTD